MQLSGGERQRVAIARALVFDPEILLADEPTGNLDIKTSIQIVNLLKSINKKGTTVFMATHNEKVIEPEDRVIILESGRLKEDKHSKNSPSHKASADAKAMADKSESKEKKEERSEKEKEEKKEK